MIRNFIEEAFTPEQLIDSIVDQAHPLVILRKIIPDRQHRRSGKSACYPEKNYSVGDSRKRTDSVLQ